MSNNEWTDMSLLSWNNIKRQLYLIFGGSRGTEEKSVFRTDPVYMRQTRTSIFLTNNTTQDLAVALICRDYVDGPLQDRVYLHAGLPQDRVYLHAGETKRFPSCDCDMNLIDYRQDETVIAGKTTIWMYCRTTNTQTKHGTT